MEVKCKVCGTINDSMNPFCSGCFLPLHKTMEQWTQDVENKINDELETKFDLEPKEEVTPFDELSDAVMEPELEIDDIPVEKIEEELENIEVPTEEKLEEDEQKDLQEIEKVEESIPTPYEEPANLENTIAMITPVTEKKYFKGVLKLLKNISKNESKTFFGVTPKTLS